MDAHEDDHTQLDLLLARIERTETDLKRARRAVAAIVALAGLCAIAWSAPSALASPPTSPFACDAGRADWYCFSPGAPARAADVNSNFEKLHRATDALATNVDSRLPKTGGAIQGSLQIGGSLSVASGLPIGVSGAYNAESYTSAITTMTSTSRSVCFLTHSSFYTPAPTNNSHPGCDVRVSGSNWVLEASNSGGTAYATCYARCISW